MSTWRILRGEGDKAMLYGVLVKILTPFGGSGHDPVRLEPVRAARVLRVNALVRWMR